MSTPTTRRAHRARTARRWTAAEDATLRAGWGVEGLVSRLQRSRIAILNRAMRLGLPPQREAARRMSLHALAARIGLSHRQLEDFLGAVALEPSAAAPVRFTSRQYCHHAIEPEPVEALFEQYLRRTSTRPAYAEERGLRLASVETALRRLQLPAWNVGRRCRVRLPVGLLDEAMANAPGLWVSVWRAVVDRAVVAPLPCAAWLVALAAHDQLTSKRAADRAWTCWLAIRVRAHVAAVVRAVRGVTRAQRIRRADAQVGAREDLGTRGKSGSALRPEIPTSAELAPGKDRSP